jgi:hypothetical protein
MYRVDAELVREFGARGNDDTDGTVSIDGPGRAGHRLGTHGRTGS